MLLAAQGHINLGFRISNLEFAPGGAFSEYVKIEETMSPPALQGSFRLDHGQNQCPQSKHAVTVGASLR